MSSDLPKRDRAAGRAKIEAQRKIEERTGFGDKEIGSGGQRTRADGVRVNGDGHPNGWQSGGR